MGQFYEPPWTRPDPSGGSARQCVLRALLLADMGTAAGGVMGPHAAARSGAAPPLDRASPAPPRRSPGHRRGWPAVRGRSVPPAAPRPPLPRRLDDVHPRPGARSGELSRRGSARSARGRLPDAEPPSLGHSGAERRADRHTLPRRATDAAGVGVPPARRGRGGLRIGRAARPDRPAQPAHARRRRRVRAPPRRPGPARSESSTSPSICRFEWGTEGGRPLQGRCAFPSASRRAELSGMASNHATNRRVSGASYSDRFCAQRKPTG